MINNISLKVLRLGQLLTAPRLSVEELTRLLEAKTIKSLIYLQDRSEKTFQDDTKLCRNYNVKYYHWPIAAPQWNRNQLGSMINKINTVDQPALIMCASNIRASALAALVAYNNGQLSIEEAIQKASSIHPKAAKFVHAFFEEQK